MDETHKKNFENTIYQLEKFQTNQLQERYEITRSAVYSRLEKLKIKPFKDSRTSYITAEQLRMMDDLHAHLRAGGKIAEFVAEHIASGEIISLEESLAVVTQSQFHKLTASQPQTLAATDEIVIDLESSRQDMIGELQAQKGEEIQVSDLQKIHERAQRRAFANAMELERLTLFYETTEEFTIPGLKEQLEQQRAASRQAEEERTAAYSDFFKNYTLTKWAKYLSSGQS